MKNQKNKQFSFGFSELQPIFDEVKDTNKRGENQIIYEFSQVSSKHYHNIRRWNRNGSTSFFIWLDLPDVERYPSAIPRPLVVRVAIFRPHREVQPADRPALFED